MDGRSFLPFLRPASASATAELAAAWRTDFMVDYHGEYKEPCELVKCPPPPKNAWHLIDGKNNTYQCVRTLTDTANSIYCEFDDAENFVEYYDMLSDPWQLQNKAKTMAPALKAQLRARLEALRECKGKACRAL